MELKQLEYFMAIADAGSISEAARILHMTQPPLSVQMKLLESEIGTELFIRSRKQIILTEAGKKLYEHGRNIINLTSSAIEEVSEIGKFRTLRIGMTPTTMPVIVPFLTELCNQEPHIRYEIYDGSTFTLKELMSRNLIDAAAVRTPITLPYKDVSIIREDHMLAVAAFPLNQKISLQELTAYPLIIYRRYFEVVMKAFRLHELNPTVFCVCDDARTALELARGTSACAIVPQSMEGSCTSLNISVINDPELETKILFVVNHGPQSPEIEKLIQLLNHAQ
ncbi:MAG: LysR family transcriptional regulator [Solobacterium sp.]|nr:LysR family transcriptional regulator [Solobacterium sp.]